MFWKHLVIPAIGVVILVCIFMFFWNKTKKWSRGGTSPPKDSL